MVKKRKAMSRERVLETALAVLDAEGLDALSMRALASELGVEAMSLYHYVESKNDLLDGVVDLVLTRIAPPDPARPWDERLEAIAIGLYEALIAHPALVLILATERGRPTDEVVLRGMDAIVAALAESGVSPARQVNAFRGLLAMCFGFVLTHTQGLSMKKAEAEKLWRQWDSTKWSPSELPHLAKLAPQFLKTHADDDFRFMLSAYLAALRAGARGK